MSVVKKRRRIATTLAAAAGIAAAVAPAAANAANITNGCRNNASVNNSQINVDTTGTAPASAIGGAAITLSNLSQTANVPGTIFATGYNLGLLTEGPNTVGGQAVTKIEGTNTLEGVQITPPTNISISTTVTDPDGVPGTGDETATDGTFTANYANLTFHGDTDGGTVLFRQDTQTPLVPAPSGNEKGTLIINTNIFISPGNNVRFACTPGTVTGPDPGVFTPIDPAPTFASTEVEAGCFGVAQASLTPAAGGFVSAGVTTEASTPPAAAGEQPFIGTNGDDVIIATTGKDYVAGKKGNDKICLLGGDDRGFGNAGNDQITGDDGNDRVFGQAGNDELYGAEGNDRTDGGGGDDTASGGNGNDTLVGGSGNDTLAGNTGNDTLDGDNSTTTAPGNADVCDGGDNVGTTAMNGGVDSAQRCETVIRVP